MGCSSDLPPRRCWPAPREFVLLNRAQFARLEEHKMKRSSGIWLAAGIALGLALSPLPASAQQQQAAPQAPLKPVSASAMQAARDLLAVKNVTQVYAGAVANIIERAKAQLLANNLNYQKDLNE